MSNHSKQPQPGGEKIYPLLELTLMRLREFVREPDALIWAFLVPLLLAAGLGVAFRDRSPDPFKVAAASPGLADALRQESLLDVQLLTLRESEEALRLGKVALAVEPADRSAVLYRYDATNPDGRAASVLADRAIQKAAGRTDPVRSAYSPVTERGSRYIDHLIPGLVGMNLLSGAIWGIGYPIVDARRRKLMKLMLTTPMPRHYYLLSFLISGLVRLTVEVGVLLGFGILVFRTPLRGSLLDLVVICVVSALSFGSLGLLVASRAQSLEAANGLMNLTMMPMWILSGVFFSSQKFPQVLQPLIQWLPLTAAIDALRANMNQAAGLGQVRLELGVLAAWFVVCFPLALRMFRWR
jgi:ABC-2 type transport system permease protein